MAPRDEFVEHLLELLRPLGDVAARRMFGGHGLTCDGLFFGIVHDGTLYLKADGQSRGAFEQAGCERFTYRRRGKIAALSFYQAPEDALEASRTLLPWARRSVATALRARAGKARRRDH